MNIKNKLLTSSILALISTGGLITTSNITTNAQTKVTNRAVLKANYKSANDLPSGLNIKQDTNSKSFQGYQALTISTFVNVTKKNVEIKPGEQIKILVPKNKAINSNKITVNGGSDYGYINVDNDSDANNTIITYTFTKTIHDTIGRFSWNLNVPFNNVQKENGTIKTSLIAGNQAFPVGSVNYEYDPIALPKSGALQANGYTQSTFANLTNYEGSGNDYAIKEVNPDCKFGNHLHGYFDPSKGDKPSFNEIIYPNGGQLMDNTGFTDRKISTTVSGKNATFDTNNIRFGVPSIKPYTPDWLNDSEYKGKWLTLGQINSALVKAGYDEIKVGFTQDNSGQATLSFSFPDGPNLQFLAIRGNYGAPDVNGIYNVNWHYTDNTKENSNNSSANENSSFSYQGSNNDGFEPVILGGDTGINLSNYNKNGDFNLKKYINDRITVIDPSTKNEKGILQIDPNDLKNIQNVLDSKETGSYQLHLSAVNSSGKEKSEKTINIIIYSNITVHYVDQNGKVIKDSQIINGEPNKSFDISPEKINGYQYLRSDVQKLNGTFGENYQPTDINFIYQKNVPNDSLATGKVIYKDVKTGNEVMPEQEIHQKISSNGNNLLTLQIPNGWKLTENEKNEVPLQAGDNQININVQKKDVNPIPPEGNVTEKINFQLVNQNGNPIENEPQNIKQGNSVNTSTNEKNESNDLQNNSNNKDMMQNNKGSDNQQDNDIQLKTDLAPNKNYNKVSGDDIQNTQDADAQQDIPNFAPLYISGEPGTRHSILPPTGYRFYDSHDATVILGNQSGSKTVKVVKGNQDNIVKDTINYVLPDGSILKKFEMPGNNQGAISGSQDYLPMISGYHFTKKQPSEFGSDQYGPFIIYGNSDATVNLNVAKDGDDNPSNNGNNQPSNGGNGSSTNGSQSDGKPINIPNKNTGSNNANGSNGVNNNSSSSNKKQKDNKKNKKAEGILPQTGETKFAYASILGIGLLTIIGLTYRVNKKRRN